MRLLKPRSGNHDNTGRRNAFGCELIRPARCRSRQAAARCAGRQYSAVTRKAINGWRQKRQIDGCLPAIRSSRFRSPVADSSRQLGQRTGPDPLGWPKKFPQRRHWNTNANASQGRKGLVSEPLTPTPRSKKPGCPRANPARPRQQPGSRSTPSHGKRHSPREILRGRCRRLRGARERSSVDLCGSR
jgi:hypothetical protein